MQIWSLMLLSWGCSLGNTRHERCTSDEQCQFAFGTSSTCGPAGFCRTSDEPTCEIVGDGVEIPYDGIDNDCDPLTPDDDLDEDGFLLVDDCDDGDRTVHWSGPLIPANGYVQSGGTEQLCEQRCVAGTELRGSLDLTEPLQDLSALACLSGVAGDVRLVQTGVPSLEGFRHVASIGGDLVVQDEPTLADLAGLDALASVGGALRVVSNDRMVRVTGGTPALATVGDLYVVDNPRLSDESALALANSLTVTGKVEVADNGRLFALVNAGFEAAVAAQPPGWLVFPKTATNLDVASAKEGAPAQGAASLALFAEAGAGGSTTVYQERFGDMVGMEFELTGQAYVPAAEALSAGCESYVAIKYFGQDFFFLGLVASTTVIDASTKPDGWIGLSVRGVVPAGAVLVQAAVEIVYDGTCQGFVYWDDLQMRVTSL